MKFFLLIALMALAVPAMTYKYEAYYQGFADQFKLSPSQETQVKTCLTALNTARDAVFPIVNAIAKGNHSPSELVLLVNTAYQQFEKTITPKCQKLVTEAEALVRKYANKAAAMNLERVAEQDIKTYHDVLTQQLFVLIDQTAEGKSYEAGKTAAQIVKIILGMEKPKALPVPNLKTLKRVPSKDLSKDAVAFTTALFKGLGLNNNVEAAHLAKTLVELVTLEKQAPQLFQKLIAAKTTDDKLKVFGEIVHVAEKVITDSKADLTLLAPVVAKFRQNPVHFIITAVKNAGLNSPVLNQIIIDLEANIIQDKPTPAGTGAARIIKTVGKGI